MTIPSTYTFVSRRDYKQRMKDALSAACKVDGNPTSDELRVIRDAARAAFIARHGDRADVAPVPNNHNLRPRAQALLPARSAPLVVQPPAPAPAPAYAPAPAPAPVEAPPTFRGPAVVQCAGECGRWLPARLGRPVLRYCGDVPLGVYTPPAIQDTADESEPGAPKQAPKSAALPRPDLGVDPNASNRHRSARRKPRTKRPSCLAA